MKKTGSQTYHNFTEDHVTEVVRAVQDGLSKMQAAGIYQMPRSTLTNKCLGRCTKPRGHSTIVSAEEEAVISKTLGVMLDWGILGSGFFGYVYKTITSIHVIFRRPKFEKIKKL